MVTLVLKRFWQQECGTTPFHFFPSLQKPTAYRRSPPISEAYLTLLYVCKNFSPTFLLLVCHKTCRREQHFCTYLAWSCCNSYRKEAKANWTVLKGPGVSLAPGKEDQDDYDRHETTVGFSSSTQTNHVIHARLQKPKKYSLRLPSMYRV